MALIRQYTYLMIIEMVLLLTVYDIMMFKGVKYGWPSMVGHHPHK